MSRRCGTGCRCKQTPSTPGGSRQKLGSGGRIRSVSRHMIDDPHPGVTREVVAEVLDNWTVKGIRTDPAGRQSWSYLAHVQGLGALVRVVVSMDDATIVSAFRDKGATQAWKRGDRSYFERRYQGMEVRDEYQGHLR